MLVATASVGLISPIAAQASDVLNLEGMNNYSRSKKSSAKRYFDSKSFDNDFNNNNLATLKGDKLGLDGSQNNFEAGSFSDTTTLDGKVIFTLGAINSPVNETGAARVSEATKATYMWQSNLNTSFTGDDNLYVRLKTGNATDWQKAYTYGTYLSSSKGNADLVKIDKIWYSFPLGKHTFWVGPKIENYYMHGTTPSIYKPVTKQFTLGGNGAAFGASTNPGIGWAYKADNGFAVSSNAVSQDGDAADGWGTDESPTSWATQIGYTKPNYSASVIVNMKYNGWTDSYYTTPLGKLRPTSAGASTGGNSTNIGLRGWWRPDDSGTKVPSISVGYDTSETDASSNSNTTAYFVGLQWQDSFLPDDRIGFAFGQPQTREDETVDPLAWEAYYSFAMNDSVTVTPAVFGAKDRGGATSTGSTDLLGAVLETEFKF